MLLIKEDLRQIFHLNQSHKRRYRNNRKHSKEEIENVLKKVNEGFNALYDELYQDTSMDIHADISVLETLLAQDGLTDQKMKGGQENGNE